MRTVWHDVDGNPRRQVAPLSLIVSAFAPVRDVRGGVTPDLKPGKSSLLLVDLGQGRNRLGASALAQVYNQVGDTPPDADEPELLRAFFDAVQELVASGLLLAYHDRSDGGAVVTLAEMAISGGRGVSVELPGKDTLAALFSEEAGVIIQVANDKLEAVLEVVRRNGLGEVCGVIGKPTDNKEFSVLVQGKSVINTTLTNLRRTWSALTCRMQTLRDNPVCAR